MVAKLRGIRSALASFAQANRHRLYRGDHRQRDAAFDRQSRSLSLQRRPRSSNLTARDPGHTSARVKSGEVQFRGARSSGESLRTFGCPPVVVICGESDLGEVWHDLRLVGPRALRNRWLAAKHP